MDTPKVLTQAEAIDIVKEYKQVIAPLFDGKVKVYLYGSYSKGNPNPWSDIDVAVIIPTLEGDWLKLTMALNRNVRKVNLRIEPILMMEDQWSPLYDDVMLTGIAV
jgi:predicted nucleotidyltransferase